MASVGEALPVAANPYAGTKLKRAGAALTDLSLVSLLQVALAQVFGVVHLVGVGGAQAEFFDGDGLSGGYFAGLSTLPAFWLIVIVVAFFIVFEGLFAATPGKALFGLRVVDERGRRASLLAVVLRNLLRPVDALPFGYGVALLSMWRSSMLQRLGDRVADTYVVPVAVARDRPFRLGQRLARGLLVAALALALVGSCAAFYYFGRPALVAQGLANLSSTYGVANTANPPSVCGPWHSSTFGNNGFGAYFGAYNAYLPRHIAEYAVGTPQRSSGVVTVSLRFRLVPWEEDSTGAIHEPVRVDRLDGPGVYDATITLRWAGLGNGGWVVAGGETNC